MLGYSLLVISDVSKCEHSLFSFLGVYVMTQRSATIQVFCVLGIF